MPHLALVCIAGLLLGFAGSSVFAADAQARLDRMATKLACHPPGTPRYDIATAMLIRPTQSLWSD
jgi:hypothetical protein